VLIPTGKSAQQAGRDMARIGEFSADSPQLRQSAPAGIVNKSLKINQ
jgi:hypothetical protein